VRPLRHLRFDARTIGGLLCAAGLALLAHPALVAAALGVELLAAGFWCWARVSDDAEAQVARWSWLRRPAAALWLATAVHVAVPAFHHSQTDWVLGPLLAVIESGAVVWAGLELLAALPLARPYSDLPGPFLAMRPWLPVLLPSAGFLILWRQADHWGSVPAVRDAAGLLLLLTATLGGLRALARRSWTASLRWAVVTDSALAALLIAHRTVAPNAVLMLWTAAAGGHALLLAGELRGAVTRRRALTVRLWRLAIWVAMVSLSWPILLGPQGRTTGGAYAPLAAVPVAIMAWLGVRRMTLAPERRRLVRVSITAMVSQVAAIAVGALGIIGLGFAWWAGFEPSWKVSIPALAPAVLGGAAALWARGLKEQPLWREVERVGTALPDVAGRSYLWFVGFERRLIGLLSRIAGILAGAMHGVHTGDAQEYLLFLMGVAVLALLVPLLQ